MTTAGNDERKNKESHQKWLVLASPHEFCIYNETGCTGNEVKTKSWFASIACMKHLCDYWSIMSAILDIALQFGAALYLNFAG